MASVNGDHSIEDSEFAGLFTSVALSPLRISIVFNRGGSLHWVLRFAFSLANGVRFCVNWLGSAELASDAVEVSNP
jgi:hypothetical protein